jgi:late competence protein required for DNA uptake (superfamily II DNA/RNA helicase)
MAVDQRDYTMRQFRQGVTRVLIATNVLARGIDVLQVIGSYSDLEGTGLDLPAHLLL